MFKFLSNGLSIQGVYNRGTFLLATVFIQDIRHPKTYMELPNLIVRNTKPPRFHCRPPSETFLDFLILPDLHQDSVTQGEVAIRWFNSRPSML